MDRVTSLTSFLDMRDVIERVKPLRPTSPRKIDSMLRIEPRSNRYTLVGTAFDLSFDKTASAAMSLRCNAFITVMKTA
jgi:hypothetical protein